MLCNNLIIIFVQIIGYLVFIYQYNYSKNLITVILIPAKATSMFRSYGSFNHQVQWRSQSPFYPVNGQMTKGLKSYYYIITRQNSIQHFCLFRY